MAIANNVAEKLSFSISIPKFKTIAPQAKSAGAQKFRASLVWTFWLQIKVANACILAGDCDQKESIEAVLYFSVPKSNKTFRFNEIDIK